jgi:hypothetical protein
LLVLMLVLGLSGVASAVPSALQLIAPPEGLPGSWLNPLEVGETMRVYVCTDSTGLGQLCVTIHATGSGAEITGGILASEAGDYGGRGTYYDPPGEWSRVGNDGWQSGLSFDSLVIDGTQIEIALGMFQSTIYGPTTEPVVLFTDAPPNMTTTNTPIAYFDIECTGAGQVTLSMTDGCPGCGPGIYNCTKMGDGTEVWDFGSPITIYQTGFNTCWDAGECAGQASGDATCDGVVSLDDLAALKAAWGMSTPWTPPHCCADFTHDGVVNLDDLAVIKLYWSYDGYSPSTGNQGCP